MNKYEKVRKPYWYMKKAGAKRVLEDSRIQKYTLCDPPYSTLIPSTGFSLSEDLATTPGSILTEYDPDPWVLRGCYVGVEVSLDSREQHVNSISCMQPR